MDIFIDVIRAIFVGLCMTLVLFFCLFFKEIKEGYLLAKRKREHPRYFELLEDVINQMNSLQYYRVTVLDKLIVKISSLCGISHNDKFDVDVFTSVLKDVDKEDYHTALSNSITHIAEILSGCMYQYTIISNKLDKAIAQVNAYVKMNDLDWGEITYKMRDEK